MKANRKFVEENEAVSAVIGVILMVAITVAIAATVYVYVTQMMPDEGSSSPQITLSQKGNVEQNGGHWVNFTVQTASTSAKWDDMKIMVNETDLDTLTKTTGAPTATDGQVGCWYDGDNKPIKSGDKLYCYFDNAEDDVLISGDCEITVIHIPSNSAILTKTIS